MSKKMLKRSLALGALMAFVITGSAMAADTFESFDKTAEKTSAAKSEWALKYDSDNTTTSVEGDRSYKYLVNDDNHGDNVYNASTVLGQSYKTGGTDLTFKNNLTIYQKTNSGRNMTGSAAAKGIDIYNGNFTVDGKTTIDVHSINNGNGTSINVAGISAWGYDYKGNDGDVLKSNTAKLVFNDDLTVNVSNVADELGYKTWKDKDYNNDVAGRATGISINEDASLFVGEGALLTVNAIGSAEQGENVVGATASAISVTAGEAKVEGSAVLTATSKAGEAYGININSTGYTATTGHFSNKAQVDFTGDVTVKAEGGTRAVGMYVENKTNDKEVAASLTGNNINITAVSDKNGLGRGLVVKSSTATVGNDNSKVKFDITSGYEEKNCGMAIWAHKAGANVTINGSSLVIEGKELNGGELYGVIASSTKVETTNNETITINSDDTDIKIVNEDNKLAGSAIVAMSGGIINATNGNVKAEAKNAILARGAATINVGAVGKEVQLTGNIDYGYDDKTSKSSIDATVNLVLDGATSYWNGDAVITSDGIEQEITMDASNAVVANVTDEQKTNHTVKSFNLQVSDNAKWATSGNSFVNTLNLDNGIIELTNVWDDETNRNNQKVLIGTATGDGTVLTHDLSNQLIINNSELDALNVQAVGAAADEIIAATGEERVEKLDYLANVVLEDIGESSGEKYVALATTVGVAESEIVGAITADVSLDENGETVLSNIKEATNTTNQAIGEAAVALKAHWRAHMNDMSKRMGDLRMANGETGVWTRMVRGEAEYEGAKAQYNQYQLGYDEKLSVDERWTVGAAVTFAEGDSTFGKGTTEDDSTAFAIYGSKLNNDGTFVDLIARYARMESDVTSYTGNTGDYSTNGYSVSAEFGKRIEQGNGLWIEPQVELTYGSIDSADYKLDGKDIHVGDMDSLIGRIGFSLGKDIKQGNVYARASYLYDFDGETETTFTNGITRTIEEDLGGGWWEVGVGANINLSKATYIYADVEKTFGGEVDTNWQWNLGVRYSF